MAHWDAVLFDCDGVLVDSEVVGLEESTRFLKERGFVFSPADIVRRYTGKRDDRFRAELLADYAEVLGRQPDEAESEALFTGLLATRRAARDNMQAVPGALGCVETVFRAGTPSAVASSSRQDMLDSKVDRFGFKPFFGRHVYSADKVAHGKPAPDIFLYAAEQIGAPPQTCLVIEDSVFGVEAGLAAGMTVFGFTGGGHCFDGHAERLLEAGAAWVADSHAALQQKIAP
jgi:beta-phosphoglucomutase-like phosphatase (HAD superfamily)